MKINLTLGKSGDIFLGMIDPIINRALIYIKSHGLTQKEFCEMINCNPTQFSRWKSGFHSPSKLRIKLIKELVRN